MKMFPRLKEVQVDARDVARMALAVGIAAVISTVLKRGMGVQYAPQQKRCPFLPLEDTMKAPIDADSEPPLS